MFLIARPNKWIIIKMTKSQNQLEEIDQFNPEIFESGILFKIFDTDSFKIVKIKINLHFYTRWDRILTRNWVI